MCSKKIVIDWTFFPCLYVRKQQSVKRSWWVESSITKLVTKKNTTQIQWLIQAMRWTYWYMMQKVSFLYFI